MAGQSKKSRKHGGNKKYCENYRKQDKQTISVIRRITNYYYKMILIKIRKVTKFKSGQTMVNAELSKFIKDSIQKDYHTFFYRGGEHKPYGLTKAKQFDIVNQSLKFVKGN
jgi:hypothetical protein